MSPKVAGFWSRALISTSSIRPGRAAKSACYHRRLFNRSVRDNIALAYPALSNERIIVAAQLADAHGSGITRRAYGKGNIGGVRTVLTA